MAAILIVATACPMANATTQAATEILVPLRRGESYRFAFLTSILTAALDRTNASYNNKITLIHRARDKDVGSDRRAKMLLAGKYDVAWAPARADLENSALRVNTPLYRGLFGYRILLIDKKVRPHIKNITDKDGLRQLMGGLGIGWTDTDIFRANDIPIVTAPSRETLWRMLAAGRFDYFPRAISEALPEMEANTEKFPNIEIDQNLLLYYPFPVFYYVNSKRPELHKRISEGVNILIQDGTFDRIWIEAHLELFHKLKVWQRNVIQLDTQHLNVIIGEWPSERLFTPEQIKRLTLEKYPNE